MILKPYKRRTFLKASAAATAVIAGAPYIKTARSAGSLRLGLWDHWVPGANDVLTEICDAWGKANGV
ncbi:MAG: twin-arginine translocation signal domain-containing protein, partial [Candidatus Competibacteraceae bacterium]|nr:twin-arginine translocation signal domain-containing protein [Candidatus Competibacteraceae bacterium]